MFYKTADSQLVSLLDEKKSNNLFEEIVQNNLPDLSKISALDENSPLRQAYNNFRRIAEKKKDRLGVVTRAISSYETWGPNKNGDAFERDELKKYYKTFFLRPHLLNHQMDIHNVRGILGDARWNNDGDYVETLILIDRENFPKYASNVEKGIINSFSMGVEVKKAICSICGHESTNPQDLCEHVRNYKGLEYFNGKPVFEFNKGLNFVEQSAVTTPADPHSHTLYILSNYKYSEHKDIERLKNISDILSSYSQDDKIKFAQEYTLIEQAADRLATRIAMDLGISFDRR